MTACTCNPAWAGAASLPLLMWTAAVSITVLVLVVFGAHGTLSFFLAFLFFFFFPFSSGSIFAFLSINFISRKAQDYLHCCSSV